MKHLYTNCVTCFCIALIFSCAPHVAVSKTINAKQLLEEIYQNKSGFGLGASESSEIIKQGGAPTYGEITYEAMQTIIDDLKLTKKDVFYDLGCGIGKAVTQVYLNAPVKKSVGVELSTTRINQANDAKKLLQKKVKPHHKHAIEFRQENIAATVLSDATVVYLCSTCYSEELMKAITDNLAKGRENLRVLTLTQLPPHKNFELVKEYHLAMTWAASLSVYLYKHKVN